MYEVIFWMCLVSNPNCDRYHAVEHQYHTFYGAPSREECEKAWINFDKRSPDPAGTKSYHVCQPVSEPL